MSIAFTQVVKLHSLKIQGPDDGELFRSDQVKLARFLFSGDVETKYLFLLYRHECFTGKYTTRKIHKRYIRDLSGLFSIISLVSLSMT